MAKEAICALLAILEHFFEAFSSVDLFFALAPFRSASSASPCFPPSRSFIDSNLFHLPPVRSSQHHPGLVPISLGDIRPCCLHLPSFCRLVSPRSRTSLRLRLPVSVHPCRPRAVRTRGVFTHRDDFGKPACVERGLVRTAMFHAPADVPRMGAPVWSVQVAAEMPETAHTWQGKVPQRAMQGRWRVQVAAETQKTAHTWRGRMSQRAMQGRLAVQVVAEMPKTTHTWQRRVPRRAIRGRWKVQV